VYGRRVVLLIGGGNNGGDALYAGAWLAGRGARVLALLAAGERTHPGGLAALHRAGGQVAGPDPALLAGADLVIDGLLGIGGSGGLRPPADRLAVAAEPLLTVAVELPSGVDADTGACAGARVQADVTVTFGCDKPAIALADCGQLRLVDIGLTLPPAEINVLEAAEVRALLPAPRDSDDKFSRGVVGVAAGSARYPGAAVLATGAALVGGAGYVRYLGAAADSVGARYPEVVLHRDTRPADVRVSAWVLGPGIGTDAAADQLLRDVLAGDVPVLVDADAITLLAARPFLVQNRTAPTVLTPHDREFARLFPAEAALLETDRLGAARRAAQRLGATVLLKGHATVVASPHGSAYVTPTGTPWLGTAGSGDVLAGLIGSLLATGLSTPLAAAVGAYVHGVAGQLAGANGPATASSVLAALGPAQQQLATG
jgi:hydroxyethylthiazole kinase-like uncharacterized protein yjeF